MATPLFDSADADLVEEVISQAELRLEAQLKVGIAADQRAMTFSGLLFAGIAVLVALAFGENSNVAYRPQLISVAIGFVIAAGLASWSARPVAWHLSGNYPSSWAEDITAGHTKAQSRAEMAANFENMLKHNDRVLRTNSCFMFAAMVTAWITAASGLLTALI